MAMAGMRVVLVATHVGGWPRVPQTTLEAGIGKLLFNEQVSVGFTGVQY